MPNDTLEIRQWASDWRFNVAVLEDAIVRLSALPIEQRTHELKFSEGDGGSAFLAFNILNELAPKLAGWVDANTRHSPDIFVDALGDMKAGLDALWTDPSGPKLPEVERAAFKALKAAEAILECTSKPAAPSEGTEADPPPSGNPAPPPSEAAAPLVILGKPGDEPIVNGRRKGRLTKPRYDVVVALLAAGKDGLSKDSLATESKHGDAHRVLKRLADSDPDWGLVIQMAEKTGCRYRIRLNLPTSPDISRKAPTKRNKA